MSNVVIVALPEKSDEVNKISSEKVAHMTLLFLGEEGQVEDLQSIIQFVEHASKLMDPFWMETDYRGELGPDNADVLFFEKDWDQQRVAQFRSQLLQNRAVKSAYNNVEQYPEWTPHLTLGYPKAPANETDRMMSLYSVRFDRIAVWTGNFEGPEFRLKYDRNYELADSSMPLIMSAADAKALFHYGVKGMKWGRRQASTSDKAPMPTPGGMKGRVAAAKKADEERRAAAKLPKKVVATPARSSAGKAVVKTEGGNNQPAHADAIKAATSKQQLHKSGINSLSNKELQDLASRLDLEARVNRLEPPRLTLGQKIVGAQIKAFEKKAQNDPVQAYKDVDGAIKTGQKFIKLAGAKR